MSRIIIDTNLWISFLIKKDFSKLDAILLLGEGTLIFSQELLREFLEVTDRPKFKKFFSSENVDKALQIIDEYAEFIQVKTVVEICRDPKDNFLLSMAKDGEVDFLLTGDKDLLDLVSFGSTVILTISDYLGGNL